MENRKQKSGEKFPPLLILLNIPTQFRLGNMPKRAMQKLITRYGCILLCGWLPPELAIACGAI